MAEVARIDVEAARQRTKSGGALLVCAYDDEEKRSRIKLEGSITLRDLEARSTALPRSQELEEGPRHASAGESREGDRSAEKDQPVVREGVSRAEHSGRHDARSQGARSHRRVMDATELMRENNIGDLVVLENDQLWGIVTDRDIVARVLGDGNDPATVTVGEICSRELTTIPSTASISDAVRLIRKAIRRLPVVEEDGGVLGIVSIGDLAVAQDRKSALADVSAAPPNT